MELFLASALDKWRNLDPKRWQRTVASIIDTFLISAPQDYKNLIRAAALKDARMAYLHSHTLKSAYGNVGAPYLQSLFAELEKTANSENWTEVEILLEKIDQKILPTMALIKTYRSTLERI